MAQGRDGQIVDLMRHRLIGRDAKRALHLCQNHTEMGHGDDMRRRMRGVHRIDHAADTGRGLVPALAARCHHIARLFPISARQLWVAFADFGKMHAVPDAEM